jgi:hypothetical protein
MCIAYTQEFVLAFMMGTHSRLGVNSALQLLDPLIIFSMAQSIIADKWYVPCLNPCHHARTGTNLYLKDAFECIQT